MTNYKGLILGKQDPVQVDNSHWKFGTYIDGIKVIDPQLHYSAFMLGYMDEHGIIDTVCERMKQYKPEVGDNLFEPMPPALNSPHIEFADRLYNMSGGYRTTFALSGSDAVESAIKLAFAHQQRNGNAHRKKIVSFTDGYHGATLLSQSVGSASLDIGFYGMPAYSEVIKVSPDMSETVDWDQVSCMVIETCPHIERMGLYADHVYEKIQRIQQEHDVIVIVDDIYMGGGRTGSFFGFKDVPVTPDIFVQAKSITGGFFPLSTAMFNEKIHNTMQGSAWIHGYTYSFSLSGVCSALAYMDVLEQHKYMERVPELVDRMTHFFKSNNINIIGRHGTFFWGEDNLRFVVPLNADDEYFDALPDTVKALKDRSNYLGWQNTLDLAKPISNTNKGGKTQ